MQICRTILDCGEMMPIDPKMKDSEIWHYAKEHHLTIITKDADFSHWILLDTPPPRVIHIKLGNMKIKTFYQKISPIWNDVLQMSQKYKLVRVYSDGIEGID